MSLQAKHSRPDIDFDSLLSKGSDTYDSAIGHWWHSRSLDSAHRRAYRHVAEVARDYCKKLKVKPRRMVDYACGTGSIFADLLEVFPHTHLIGLDGSKQLLQELESSHKDLCERLDQNHAFTAPTKPVSLTLSALPNFRLPAGLCDLALLVFPNLVPDPQHLAVFNRNGYCNKKDSEIAHMLARFREMDPEDDTGTIPEEEWYDDLMTTRVFSRNLRHLLRTGGLLVRVEYTQADRKELTELTQWRSLFGEGALEAPIKGKPSDPFFRLVGSEYRRSKVILDVFHQTGDPDDRRGGYMISVFQAI